MLTPRFIRISTAIMALLFIPLVAMQFTDEVKWSVFDFIVAGALLLTTVFACELVLRKVTNTQHRIILCLFVLAIFFMIWAELAVGIFGTSFAGS